MAEIDAGSFQILSGGAFGGFPQFFLKGDWNQDGVFADSEELSSDTMFVSWNRGSESEEDNTPAGTLLFTVNDPFGDYVPGSTVSKWRTTESDLVTIDREVSLRIVYKDTTYPGFRGRITKITPNLTPDNQTATILCVDGFDELGAKTISSPIASGSTGGIVNSGGQPIQDDTPGSADGHISRVLDQSSWASNRRNLDTSGAPFDWWWSYEENARTALNKIEDHSRGTIFINGNGDVTFQSSTHRDGVTQLATFNENFQDWDYAFSGRSIKNHVEISVHLRTVAVSTEVDSSTVGFVKSNGLPSIADGTTFTTRIVFDKTPCITVATPLIGVNGAGDVSIVGAGGTSYASTDVTINGVLIAGTAMDISIINNAGESVTINEVEGGGKRANETLHITGIPLDESVITVVATDANSISTGRKRSFTADYIFFDESSNGQRIADDVINKFAVGRPDFTRLRLEGSDSNSITQVISRELGDKICVTSTSLKITNRDYHINSAEWEINPNAPLSVVWSLEEST